MSAAKLALEIENALFGTFDNTKQALDNLDRQGATYAIAAFANTLNATISGTGLAAQAGAYVFAGGTAPQLSGFFTGLTAVGLAIDFAASFVNVGAAYQTYVSDPTQHNQDLLTLAAGKLMFQVVVASLAYTYGFEIGAIALAFGLAGQLLDHQATEDFFKFMVDPFLAPKHDPIVMDLDGNGVELSNLNGSTVHYDFGVDGSAERTGWVALADGILTIDSNENGVVDSALELFGSSTQDGFAVLEKLDTNGDGRIDTQDAEFGKLRIWRDLNQNGVSDSGELQSFAEAGVSSISLVREKLTGTNAGHGLGYQAIFTRADGTTGAAHTIYFQTDPEHSISDNTLRSPSCAR